MLSEGGYVHTEGDANWDSVGRISLSERCRRAGAGIEYRASTFLPLPRRFRSIGSVMAESYDKSELLLTKTRTPHGTLCSRRIITA